MSDHNKVGDRVGAVMDRDGGIIHLFGYGVYEGDFVPEEGVYMMGIDMHARGQTNPRIRLDDGSTVYGCECWWGPEHLIKQGIEGKDIHMVNVPEYRQRAKEEFEKGQKAQMPAQQQQQPKSQRVDPLPPRLRPDHDVSEGSWAPED